MGDPRQRYTLASADADTPVPSGRGAAAPPTPFGDEAVQELRRQHAGDGEQRDLYQAMFERIVAAQPLPESATRVLAVERAREIADYLQDQGIDRSRIRTGRLASVGTGGDGEVSSQLQLAAVAQSGN